MSILKPIDGQGAWRAFRDTPVPVPASGIGDNPKLSICFNSDWLTPIMTALKAMARPEFWSAEDNDAIRSACVDALSFEQNIGCSVAIQFRSPTACTLEFSDDGGETWTQIFDVNACIYQDLLDGVIASGQGKPDGAGTPGNCASFNMVVPSTGVVALPRLVSTWDTIQLTSIDVGPWIDDFTQLHAYCSDGKVWSFPSGCGADEAAHTGDPLMTANHMAVILLIEGTYYDVSDGSLFTVPSGVTNAIATLQPNDSVLGDNLFSIGCVVEQCNQQWEHIFDFSIDDGGFSVLSGFQGSYVGGSGWFTDYAPGGGGQQQFVITRSISSTSDVSEIIAELDAANIGNVQTGFSYCTNGGLTTNFSNVLVTSTGDHDWDSLTPGTLVTDFTVVLNGYNMTAPQTMLLKKLTLRGIGSDPF